eukprot:scaffold34519_cov146-Isochrysis_galbana.AAC.1
MLKKKGRALTTAYVHGVWTEIRRRSVGGRPQRPRAQTHRQPCFPGTLVDLHVCTHNHELAPPDFMYICLYIVT